ncbi:MAG: haloacid dehalogenase-like hydrolase [Anaeroplasmataceae bacterium]
MKTKVAFLYDFDKTLCTKDMQEYSFIPNVNLTASQFWQNTSDRYKNGEMDKILAYMYEMIISAKKSNIKLTRNYLNDCGKNIEYFNGVETWFDRINEFADGLNIEIEHYVISSGLLEIIEGSTIFKNFKQVYSCEFLYEDDVAVFPAYSINYTMKTQFLFRISKGIFELNNDTDLNTKQNEKYIEIDNMIYFGDGITDIPIMNLVKNANGNSILVFDKMNFEKIKTIVKDDRCTHYCEADYSTDSVLDKTVKKCLEKIKIDNELLVSKKKIQKKLEV